MIMHQESKSEGLIGLFGGSCENLQGRAVINMLQLLSFDCDTWGNDQLLKIKLISLYFNIIKIYKFYRNCYQHLEVIAAKIARLYFTKWYLNVLRLCNINIIKTYQESVSINYLMSRESQLLPIRIYQRPVYGQTVGSVQLVPIRGGYHLLASSSLSTTYIVTFAKKEGRVE